MAQRTPAARTAVLPQARIQRAPDEAKPASDNAEMPLQLWRAAYSEARPPEVQASRGEAGDGKSDGSFGSLALTPARSPTVQRTVDKAAIRRRTASRKIQRADENAKADSKDTKAKSKPDAKDTPVDLADLARKIYPLIRRMLALERERR
jgi:hypothetical protein